MTDYWVVHESSDIYGMFRKHSVVTIGYGLNEDISGLSLDQMRERLRQLYPDRRLYPDRNLAVRAGRLATFKEIAVGDIVLTRQAGRQEIHISRVTGPYQFNPRPPDGLNRHARPIEHRATVSKSELSLPLQTGLKPNLGFYSVSGHAEEIQQLLGDRPQPSEIDINLLNPQNIEPRSRRHILDFLIANFPAHDFERVVEHVLTAMGFEVEGHGPGADGGVDLIVRQGVFGFDQIVVQVKNQQAPAGASVVRNLRGTRESGRKLFVSASGYTQDARNEAGADIRLLNGLQLVDLLIEHYENLPVEFKARVPLKPVYLLALRGEEDEVAG